MKFFCFLIAFSIYSFHAFAQNESDFQILLEKYNSSGDAALKEYITVNKNITTRNSIRNLAQNGLIEMDEKKLNIALISARAFDSKDLIASVFFRIASMYYNQTYFDKSLFYLDSTLFYCSLAADSLGSADAERMRGNVYSAKNEFVKSLNYYQNSIAIFNNLINKYPKPSAWGLGLAYRAYAQARYQVGEKSIALALFDSAEKYSSISKDINGIAAIYIAKGDLLALDNKKDEALSFFQKAIDTLKKYNNVSSYSNLGNAYLSSAEIFEIKGEQKKFDESVESAKKYLQNSGNYFSLGKAFELKAENLIRIGAVEDAFEQLDTAYLYFEQIQDYVLMGEVERIRSEIFLEQNKNEQAKRCLDRALKCFEKSNSFLRSAYAYKLKATAFIREVKYKEAKDCLSKAYSHFIAEKSFSAAAQTLIIQSSIALKENDYTLSNKLLDSARVFLIKEKDNIGLGDLFKNKSEIFAKTGKNDSANFNLDSALYYYSLEKSQKNINAVMKMKGDLAFYTGANDIAMKFYDKALEGLQNNPDVFLLSAITRSQGFIKMREGKWEDAKKIFESSAKSFEKAKDLKGLANSINGLAEIYLREGNLEFAKFNYYKSLKIFEKINDFQGIGNVNKGLGEIYFLKKDNDSSMLFFKNAISAFEKSGDPIGKGNARKGIAELLFLKNDYSNALFEIEKALDFYAQINNIANASSACVLKARILSKLGKIDESINYYNKAINYTEKIRRSMIDGESRVSFMKTMYSRYEEASYYLLANNKIEEAFRIIESMKARAFLDLLAESRVELDKGINSDLKNQRDDLERRVEDYIKMKAELIISNETDKSRINLVQSKIDEYDAKLQEIKTKIKLQNPIYATIQYPEPVKFDDLKNVLQNNEVLTEYLITDSASFCIIATNSELKRVKLPFDNSSIKLEMDKFKQAIKEKNNDFITNNNLFDYLIKPIETYIKGKQIYVIPDGAISELPFEAIYNKQFKEYLLESADITYYPSASSLVFFKNQNKKSGKQNSNKLLCFADPVYDYDNYIKGVIELGDAESSREIYKLQGPLNRLKATNDEALEIDKIFKSNNLSSTLFMRNKADEGEIYKLKLEEYSNLHFAVHGFASNELQALILSQIPNSNNDGFLTLDEILNLKLNCNLATLSACQTGLGKFEKGEGISGLSRAFMSSGAKSVLASLWSVNDKATSLLMIEFYKNLIDKKQNNGIALKNAKKSIIGNKEYSHPYYWGAFILFGSID